MRSEEVAPDTTNDAGTPSDSNNPGTSGSSGSKEAQNTRGAKRVSGNDGRADLDEAQLEMAKRAAESGLEIMRTREGKRSEATVAEREVRARIPESRGQKRISENDGRVDLDEAGSEVATKNTRIGQVHISKTAIRWCDINDEIENDPLLNVDNWWKKEVRFEGRALREAPHISRDSNPETETPLLTAPSDEPLGGVGFM